MRFIAIQILFSTTYYGSFILHPQPASAPTPTFKFQYKLYFIIVTAHMIYPHFENVFHVDKREEVENFPIHIFIENFGVRQKPPLQKYPWTTSYPEKYLAKNKH